MSDNQIRGQVQGYADGVYKYRPGSMRKPMWMPNYATARAWYDIVPRIRGRQTDVRPVGRRSWPSDIRLDGPNEDVVVRLYSTDIIRYRKDDTILINNGGWPTETTHKELRQILGMWINTHNSQTWIACHLEDQPGTVMRLPIPNGEDVALRINPRDWHHPVILTPTFPKTHVINRKAANAMRRKYKAAVNTMKAMIKVRGEGYEKLRWSTSEADMVPYIAVFGGVETETGRWDHNTQTYRTMIITVPDIPGDPVVHCKSVMSTGRGPYTKYTQLESHAFHDQFMGYMTSDDPQDHYKALLWMSAYHQIDNPAKVMRALDKILLRIHRDEVFEEVEVRSGRWVKDAYAGYFE
jgi:hypothetical protein